MATEDTSVNSNETTESVEENTNDLANSDDTSGNEDSNAEANAEADTSAEDEKKAKVDSKQVKTDKLTKKEEKQIKTAIKKLKLKVDGKEIEEELPFDLPDDPKAQEYLIKQLQMAKMGSKRAQEYSTLDKQVNEFLKTLKTNPKAILTDPDLGIDVNAFIENYLNEQIENSKKSPEQVEKEKLENELKTLRDEQKKKEEEYKLKEIERQKEQYYNQVNNELLAELKSNHLPDNALIREKVGHYLQLGLMNGYDVTVKDVMPIVVQDLRNDIKSLIDTMPDDMMEEYIGKQIYDKMKKKQLDKAKTKVTVPSKKTPDIGVKAEDKQVKPSSMKDFFKSIR